MGGGERGGRVEFKGRREGINRGRMSWRGRLSPGVREIGAHARASGVGVGCVLSLVSCNVFSPQGRAPHAGRVFGIQGV